VFTLFLPGIESASSLPRMPALETILARGRARPLTGSAWTFLAGLAGSDTLHYPVGPVSALADLDNAPRACLRAEPVGADVDQRAMFRLPAAGLGIEAHEAHALAVAFRETFGGDGLRLEVATPERWYLAWDHSDPGRSGWRGFPGPIYASGDGGRPSPPEPALRRLLSEVELLFHGHAVNAARRERGEPVIAGLHAWGGGALQDNVSPVAAPADALGPGTREEPYLAGLRRLGLIASAGAAPASAGGPAPDGIAWPVAAGSLPAGSPEALERDWAAPLVRLLHRGRIDGVRIVTGRAIHETWRTDMLRLWRRARPVPELC
jgi:hypothetical protein